MSQELKKDVVMLWGLWFFFDFSVGSRMFSIWPSPHVSARYCYSLHQQFFTQAAAEAKVRTITVEHLTASIRVHGYGVINTLVNYNVGFLKKKLEVPKSTSTNQTARQCKKNTSSSVRLLLNLMSRPSMRHIWWHHNHIEWRSPEHSETEVFLHSIFSLVFWKRWICFRMLSSLRWWQNSWQMNQWSLDCWRSSNGWRDGRPIPGRVPLKQRVSSVVSIQVSSIEYRTNEAIWSHIWCHDMSWMSWCHEYHNFIQFSDKS